mgnify:FL=1
MNKLYLGLAIIAVILVLYVIVRLLSSGAAGATGDAGAVSPAAASEKAVSTGMMDQLPAADPALGCLSEPGLHLTRGWVEGDAHV